MKSLALWAKDDDGPLTIKDPSGKIHLALFKQIDNFRPSTAIAFNATGKEFLEWKNHLKKQNLLPIKK